MPGVGPSSAGITGKRYRGALNNHRVPAGVDAFCSHLLLNHVLAAHNLGCELTPRTMATNGNVLLLVKRHRATSRPREGRRAAGC